MHSEGTCSVLIQYSFHQGCSGCDFCVSGDASCKYKLTYCKVVFSYYGMYYVCHLTLWQLTLGYPGHCSVGISNGRQSEMFV